MDLSEHWEALDGVSRRQVSDLARAGRPAADAPTAALVQWWAARRLTTLQRHAVACCVVVTVTLLLAVRLLVPSALGAFAGSALPWVVGALSGLGTAGLQGRRREQLRRAVLLNSPHRCRCGCGTRVVGVTPRAGVSRW